MVGTPVKIAPEVLEGTGYTIKADIWSLGILLAEMTPKAAFEQARGSDKGTASHIPLERALWPPLKQLVLSCLKEKASERPSADEIRASLTDLLQKAPSNAKDVVKKCAVCSEQPCAVQIACGHVVLCEACAVMLLNQPQTAECPRCHKQFTEYLASKMP